MNKQKQRISNADLKRCDDALIAVRKMARLEQCKRFESCGRYAASLIDFLERLKMTYAMLVGVNLTNEPLPERSKLLRMIGKVNAMYAFAYPAPNGAEWRAVILKPITITLERVDWQFSISDKFMKS